MSPPRNSLWKKVPFWMATGFGFGFAPVAPGTIGSLWGLPLAWCIMQIPSISLQIVVIALLYAIGIPICTAAARALGKKDPGQVVWDEIATVPIAFLFVAPDRMNHPGILLLGFTLHRIFDITKPPPVRNLERWPAGLGIMSDDVAAGAYACWSMHLLLWAGSRLL